MDHRAHPVSQAELARRLGRHRSRISDAVVEGGPLAPAVLASGRIDAAHPCVAEWARERDIDPARALDLATREPERESRADSDTRAESASRAVRTELAGKKVDLVELRDPENTAELLDLTLRQIGERWASHKDFNDLLDARKKAAEIRRLELANRETSGELISRELVAGHVFAAIDAANRKLVGDAPKTIARELYIAAQTGEPIEEAERIARALVSAHLSRLKASAARSLDSETTPDAVADGVAAGMQLVLDALEDLLDAETYVRVLEAFTAGLDDPPNRRLQARDREQREWLASQFEALTTE